MAKMYYEADCDRNLLSGKTIAVIGYGSQGHAHALNLRDSGANVVVGLYEGSKSAERAREAGLTVLLTAEAVKIADMVMILVNDEKQAALYADSVAEGLVEGNTLVFAHGFNIHFGQIIPPCNVDVIMVAPKGPGHTVRSEYQRGAGVPNLIAVYQDFTGKAKETALAYAAGIGGARAGILETTFREETETDLFGEQAVLCGGASALVMAGFDTLIEAGYQPEIAYFEVLHELKLITDLIQEFGISGMRRRVSNTACYGDVSRGKRIINDRVRKEMKKVLKEIVSGKFAREWIKENETGRVNFNKMLKDGDAHKIEKVGQDLRKMMPWMG